MSGRAKLTQSKARDGLFDRVSLACEAQGEQVRKEMQVKGFKEFLLRGNVVDLAVAVVIGAAFGAIVTAFVKDLLTPLIAAIGGQPDFSGLYFTINNSKFLFGDFINAVVSFVIIAAVVYFFVVLPINKLIQLSRKEPPADPTTRKCPYCLSTIPIAATRCAYCTSQIEVPSVQSASAG